MSQVAQQVSLADLQVYTQELRQYKGVYLLYYQGDVEAYSGYMAESSWLPVYVGKTSPKGSRSARSINLPAKPSSEGNLYVRLSEHKRSIESAGLSAADFRFSVIGLPSEDTPWAEIVLIRHFEPIWNTMISGFGIHAPGAGRQGQRQSTWDLLHQGRTFSSSLTSVKGVRTADVAQLREAITLHVQDIKGRLGE